MRLPYSYRQAQPERSIGRALRGKAARLFAAVVLLASVACEPPGPPATDGVTASAGQPFQLGVGQTADLPGEHLSVTVNRIVEDTRCPTGLMCFWSGQLIAKISVTQYGMPARLFELNSIDANRPHTRPMVGDFNIALVDVSPARTLDPTTAPPSPRPIAESDYRLSILVSKVTTATASPDSAGIDTRVLIPNGATAVYPAEGLKVRFDSVLADARCPNNINVNCASLGTATIRLVAEKGGASQTVELSIFGKVDDTTLFVDKPGSTDYLGAAFGYNIRLVHLDPMPTQPGENPAPETYVATLLVTRQ